MLSQTHGDTQVTCLHHFTGIKQLYEVKIMMKTRSHGTTYWYRFKKSRSDTRFSCLVEVVVHVGIDRDAYTERRQLNSIIQAVFISKTNKQSHKYIIIAAVKCLI